MTSQKRYRQHQESNKNSSRFRDLPPRFKRQKSVSAATSPSAPEAEAPTTVAPAATATSTVAPAATATSTVAPAATATSTVAPVIAAIQKDTEIIYPAAVKKTDPQQPVLSPMAPSNFVVYPVEEGHQSPLRPRPDLYQTPISATQSWQWPAKSDTFILSQWDNSQFNRASNIQPPTVPLGTHFGYKMDSPPLSPWASASNFTGQLCMAGCPSWSPASDLFTSQEMHSPSMYFNNENWAPNQNLMYPHSPEGSWGKPSTPQHLFNSPSPILQDHASSPIIQGHASSPIIQGHAHLSPRYVENRTTSGSSARPQVDYTDPDIRTIEMLRELERVADEKESEDFGVDRKSLVSHHLRMLMCAVDKYTEGVEDETSRRDEVSLATDSGASTPQISPASLEVKEKQTKVDKKRAKLESGSSMWSSDNDKSSWNNLGIEQDSLAARQPAAHIQHRKPPLQQASQCEKPPNSIGGQNVAWDLWFSPSFDLPGFLHQNLDDFTRNPFSRLRGNDEKDRKPLYRR